MYKGKYIADKQNNDSNTHQSYNRTSSKTVMLRRRQRRQRRLVLCGLGVIVIIIAIISIIVFKPKDKTPSTPDLISGTWVYDQYTKYEFDGYGKGCMCIENSHYEYSYKINSDILSMDFENEAVHDCSYTFKVDENKLTIIGGEGTTGGTYTLNKE